jgi:hypothetical protein
MVMAGATNHDERCERGTRGRKEKEKARNEESKEEEERVKTNQVT